MSARRVYDRAHSLVLISRFLVSFASARDHSLFNVVVVSDRAEEEEAYDDGCGEDTAPRAPRPSSPLSYRTVPSLLSALAIEDAVLLRGRGRRVAHMMHASPRSFSFTMVQASHSHDDDMMLE